MRCRRQYPFLRIHPAGGPTLQQIPDLADFAATFLAKRVLAILTRTVLPTLGQLLVMRPCQIAATEAILQPASDFNHGQADRQCCRRRIHLAHDGLLEDPYLLQNHFKRRHGSRGVLFVV